MESQKHYNEFLLASKFWINMQWVATGPQSAAALLRESRAVRDEKFTRLMNSQSFKEEENLECLAPVIWRLDCTCINVVAQEVKTVNTKEALSNVS